MGCFAYVRKNIIMDINRSKVYRAKRKAKEIIEEDERLQYEKLRNYVD